MGRTSAHSSGGSPQPAERCRGLAPRGRRGAISPLASGSGFNDHGGAREPWSSTTRALPGPELHGQRHARAHGRSADHGRPKRCSLEVVARLASKVIVGTLDYQDRGWFDVPDRVEDARQEYTAARRSAEEMLRIVRDGGRSGRLGSDR
jgi:hypothetical protein